MAGKIGSSARKGRWGDLLAVGYCYGLNCVLPNPTPGPQDVTVCGDGTFKEVTEVELGLKVGPSSHKTGVLLRGDQNTVTQ